MSQLALFVAIACLGLVNPQTSLTVLIIMAVAIAFFSASQDIALDAFRREFLSNEELGLGTGLSYPAFFNI